MTGEELFQKLQAMTAEDRALPVFHQAGYLDPVQDVEVKNVTEDWTPDSVQLRDFWPEMEEPRPALGSRVIVL